VKYNDATITVQELKESIKKFHQFHPIEKLKSPKVLATLITTQASELLNLFLGKTDKKIIQLFKTDHLFREKIETELANIFFASLNFTENLKIEVSPTLLARLKEWETTKTCPQCALILKKGESFSKLFQLSRKVSDDCSCVTCDLLRKTQKELDKPCDLCGRRPWSYEDKIQTKKPIFKRKNPVKRKNLSTEK
jgi:hypothetical protein